MNPDKIKESLAKCTVYQDLFDTLKQIDIAFLIDIRNTFNAMKRYSDLTMRDEAILGIVNIEISNRKYAKKKA